MLILHYNYFNVWVSDTRRTLHFWNHIIAGNNAHSFVCVRLFLHASTKVSCVGFIIWCPFREMRRTLHFWNHIIASNNAHSFACVLLFPKSTKYLLGAPDFARCHWTKQCCDKSLFCEHVFPHTSYASFLTSQSPQATIACLMLAYSFSPKVQSIFWGPRFSARNDIKSVERKGTTAVIHIQSGSETFSLQKIIYWHCTREVV